MLITSSGRFNQENIGEIKDIARRYNTTVIDLMNLNNLTSTNLEIGQVLKVREL